MTLLKSSKLKYTSVSVLALGCALLGGCETIGATHEDAQLQSSHAEYESKPELDGHKDATKKPSSHWEYEGEHGPSHWGNMSEKFAACKTGRLQSPFHITADINASLPHLGLNYKTVLLKILNNGHTIQADQTGAGQLIVGNAIYDLLQFHFHTPSEYTIDGKSFPLEMHLVHTNASGALAVVGVMFEEGAHNAELEKIWANMPTEKGDVSVEEQMIDASKLLPKTKSYLRFMGSLTTPPCSEGVNWHMMQTPITASAPQIAAFKAIHPMNARPLQPKNNRLVVKGR